MTHPSTPRIKRNRVEKTTPVMKATATEVAGKPGTLRIGEGSDGG